MQQNDRKPKKKKRKRATADKDGAGTQDEDAKSSAKAEAMEVEAFDYASAPNILDDGSDHEAAAPSAKKRQKHAKGETPRYCEQYSALLIAIARGYRVERIVLWELPGSAQGT